MKTAFKKDPMQILVNWINQHQSQELQKEIQYQLQKEIKFVFWEKELNFKVSLWLELSINLA